MSLMDLFLGKRDPVFLDRNHAMLLSKSLSPTIAKAEKEFNPQSSVPEAIKLLQGLIMEIGASLEALAKYTNYKPGKK